MIHTRNKLQLYKQSASLTTQKSALHCPNILAVSSNEKFFKIKFEGVFDKAFFSTEKYMNS